jgi:hypothetical protein
VTGATGSVGATGPTGPTGPSLTTRGVAKFSGVIGPGGNMFLADTGTVAISPSNIFPAYPTPSPRNLFNLAANLGEFVVPEAGSVLFEVQANGGFIAGYSITFNPGDTGVKSLLFGPVFVPANGTFAIRVTPSDGTTLGQIPVSALIEIE